MNSARRTAALPAVGFPIRTSSDQSLVSGSPGLFAATHVLLRLLSPRHPSCALCSLVISLPRPRPKSEDQGPARLIADPQHTCLLAHMQFSKNGFWWSRSGSNRRHPACKAGALPAELRPQKTRDVVSWWAWIDLNYRPHAYQACALTS